MTNGVFALVLIVIWLVMMRSGRPFGMSIAALAVGIVLAGNGGPLASTATTLLASARTIATTVGAAIGGG